MKKIHLLLILIAGVTSATAFAQSPTLKELLNLGKAEEAKGNWTEAIAYYDKVLAKRPREPMVISLKKNAELRQRDSIVRISPFEKELAIVRISEVNFEKAPVEEVLEFGRLHAIKAGKKAPNFIVAPELRGGDQITLNLSDIPLNEVVRYVAELSGAEVRYEKHGIRLTPKKTAAKEAAAN